MARAAEPARHFRGKLFMAVLIVVFGFFFVTVSSRIVGIIGSSSNPISGMTIATLLATCLVFVSLAWAATSHQSMALMVGAIVCIASANAGATSQDLKTGYPRRRHADQAADRPRHRRARLDAGHRRHDPAPRHCTRDPRRELHGIGSTKMPAPQGTLMATIIKGLLSQNLPWGPCSSASFLALDGAALRRARRSPGRSAPTCRSRRRCRSSSAA